MSKILALLFATAIFSFVRTDDIADNKLDDGDLIALDSEVGEGQVDNMSAETADDEADNETATFEINLEGEDRVAKSTNLHITFRKKYLAKNKDRKHAQNVKKTPEEFWKDLIEPQMAKQKIMPLDGSKPLVSLLLT